jgi:quercetin dioxygenase-like cupin family protein
MSGKLDIHGNPPPNIANGEEIFSPDKDRRPTNVYLTKISENDADYCLILATLPPGTVVPMHSHADRETFYVLSGNIEGLRVNQWEKLGPGDVFDVSDGAKHAWRNSSQASASMLCVTTTRMARFLRDISVSDGDNATQDAQAQRFLELVRAHGYWLASPEENAAVGLTVNWNGSGD